MRRVSIIFIIAIMLIFGGCNFIGQGEQMTSSSNFAEKQLTDMMDALTQNDEEAAYKLFLEGGIERTNFSESFSRMRGIWDGQNNYEYKMTGINSSKTIGTETTASLECSFLLTASDSKIFEVSFTFEEHNDASGLTNFKLARTESIG